MTESMENDPPPELSSIPRSLISSLVARFRHVLVAAALAVVVVVLALATGIPQRILLTRLVQSQTGLHAEFSGVGLVGSVRADSMSLRALEANDETEPSFVDIQGLDIDYTLFPKRNRYVSSVTASALDVHLIRHESGASNYAIEIGPQRRRGGGRDIFRYIPRTIFIQNIGVTLETPERGIVVRGLSLQSSLERLSALSLSIRGDDISGEWRIDRASARSPLSGGKVDIQCRTESGNVLLSPGRISLPGVLDADIEATATPIAMGANIDLNVKTLTAQAAATGLVAPFVPVPMTFQSVTISDSRISGSWSILGPALAGIALHAAIEGLEIGAPDEPLYAGDVLLELTTDASGGKGEITLSKGVKLDIAIDGKPPQSLARLHTGEWTRDDLTAAFPHYGSVALKTVPGLGSFRGDFEADWRTRDHAVSAALQSSFKHGGEDVPLSCTVEGRPSEFQQSHLGPFTGALLLGREGSLGKTTFEFTIIPSLGSIETVQKLYQVSLSAGCSVIEAPAMLRSMAGDLSGDIRIEHQETTRIEADVAIDRFRLSSQAIELPHVAAIGAAEFSPLTGTMTANKVEFASTDAFDVALSNVTWNATSGALSTSMAIEADLAYVAAQLGLPNIQGEMSGRADVASEGGIFTVAPQLEIVNMIYGQSARFLDSPITVSGAVTIDSTSKTIEMAKGTVQRGVTDTMVLSDLRVSSNPASATSKLSVQSDLGILANLGFAKSAAGHGVLDGLFAFDDGGRMCEVSVDLNSTEWLLPNAVAAIAGFSLEGNCRITDQISGELLVGIESGTAGGVALGTASGKLVGREQRLLIQELTLPLLGGAARIRGTIGLLEEGFPIDLDIRLDSIDLAVLTKELDLPSVTLTGIAEGRAHARILAGALDDFSIAMKAKEDFSVNRDLVKQLLLSEYVHGIPLSGNIRATIDKTIGESEQRPFERASLELQLVEERLEGAAPLLSKDLDLNLTLKIDLKEIYAALKLRQEASLGNVESVGLAPTP